MRHAGASEVQPVHEDRQLLMGTQAKPNLRCHRQRRHLREKKANLNPGTDAPGI